MDLAHSVAGRRIHGRVRMLNEIMEGFSVSGISGDMKVAEQPEGTLLTATEEALAAELATATMNSAPEDA
ncbi:hypothetical protein GCM10027563_02180 [Parasphingorhabdus pacifica]